MDFGSGALAGISVSLELVTQYMLLAIELTHVVHTALEEWSRIHHIDTLPATERNTQMVKDRKKPNISCVTLLEIQTVEQCINVYVL